MSRFFFPGKTTDALSGQPIGARADAAALPAWPPGFEGAFADPASRWVSRQSWDTWPRRDVWVERAVEVLAAIPPPPGLTVDRWVDALRVRYSPRLDLWALLDVRHLLALDGSADELVGLGRVVAAGGGRCPLGAFDLDLGRSETFGSARTFARVVLSQHDEPVEELTLPWSRVERWSSATAG